MRSSFFSAGAAIALLVCAVRGFAQTPFTLPFSTGWETSGSPAWTVNNNVTGQNGWVTDGVPEGSRVVGVTVISSQSVSPKTGSQMVQCQTSYAGSAFRGVSPDPVALASSWTANLAQTPVFVLEADVYMPGSEASKDGWQGLYVFDNTAAGNAIAGVLLRNSKNTLTLEADGSTTVSQVFTRNQWFHLQLIVDFKNAMAYTYVNGKLLAQDTASNTATTKTSDGSGNIGFAGLCSLSPAADATGRIYTPNPNAAPPGDPNAYYAPQASAFADNLAMSAIGSAQAPAIGPAAAAAITLDGVSDLNAVPPAIPYGLPGTTVTNDLVGNIDVYVRTLGGGTDIVQKSEPLRNTSGGTGYVYLYGIPAGNYDIGFKPSNGLQSIVANVGIAAADVSLPATNLAGGDADDNNTVNFDDFLMLLNAFGAVSSDPTAPYDASADFNYDGIVNFDDFLILLNNFGANGASPYPTQLP